MGVCDGVGVGAMVAVRVAVGGRGDADGVEVQNACGMVVAVAVG